MSLDALRAVLEKSKAPPHERHVLTVIASHVNLKTGLAWMSEETLARETGYSVRQVRRHVRASEGRGELTITERSAGRRTHRYRVSIGTTGSPANPDTDAPAGGNGNPDIEGTEPGHPGAEPGHGCPPNHRTRGKRPPRGCSPRKAQNGTGAEASGSRDEAEERAKLVVQAFQENYLKRRGIPCADNASRMTRYIRALPPQFTSDRLLAAVRQFFRSNDAWIEKMGYGWVAFRTRLHGLVGEVKRPERPSKTWRPPWALESKPAQRSAHATQDDETASAHGVPSDVPGSRAMRDPEARVLLKRWAERGRGRSNGVGEEEVASHAPSGESREASQPTSRS